MLLRFTILPRDFATETGELTSTLKLKRSVAEKMNIASIDALYASSSSMLQRLPFSQQPCPSFSVFLLQPMLRMCQPKQNNWSSSTKSTLYCNMFPSTLQSATRAHLQSSKHIAAVLYIMFCSGISLQQQQQAGYVLG